MYSATENAASNLELFIKAIQQADFSILESKTRHTGLREIQEIARSKQTDNQKFAAMYEVIYHRMHGWGGGRKWLSEYQFLGNGRNFTVSHLYSRILDLRHNVRPGIDSGIDMQSFKEILKLPEISKNTTLIKHDAIISQCFRNTKKTIYKQLAIHIGQYNGHILREQDATDATENGTDFSQKWSELIDEAHSQANYSTSTSPSEHRGLSLMHRALDQYDDNIKKYPLQITGAQSLLIAQQKREAIQLLQQRLDEVKNGVLSLTAGTLTDKKVQALQELINALKDDNNPKSARDIIVASLRGSCDLWNDLNKYRLSSIDSKKSKTMELIDSIILWGNLDEFKFLSNSELDVQDFIVQLTQYKEQRTGEYDSVFSFFIHDYGFSKKFKIDAVDKLFNHLNNDPQIFSSSEIIALTDGRVGLIVNQIAKKLPNKLPVMLTNQCGIKFAEEKRTDKIPNDKKSLIALIDTHMAYLFAQGTKESGEWKSGSAEIQKYNVLSASKQYLQGSIGMKYLELCLSENEDYSAGITSLTNKIVHKTLTFDDISEVRESSLII